MLFRYLWAICLVASCGACTVYAAEAPDATASDASAPASTPQAEFSSAYRRYQELVADKNFEEALPYAERAYELGIQIYGPKHKNTAALALNLGDTQLKIGYHTAAVTTLDTAVSLYQKVYGKDAFEVVDPLMARGDATGPIDPKQQDGYYKRALRIARIHLAADDLLLARLNLEAGVRLMQAGNAAAAKPHFADAYTQYKSQLPATDPRFGSAAFWMGKNVLVSGNAELSDPYIIQGAALSEPYFIEALKALEPEGVAPDTLALATHGLLVDVYTQLNDPAKATEQCLIVGKFQPAGKPLTAPLYRANPHYPAAARASKQEGWVRVEFTIDATGSVRDPKVVDTDGTETFAEAALSAIAQWRYAPRFVDGSPVDTSGVQVVLRFELPH